jgi:hypothetical protein
MTTPDTEPRSPRAEIARGWFWTCFGLNWVIKFVLVELLNLDFLQEGGWLVLRYALLVAITVSGAVWAWETFQRHRRTKNQPEG